MGGYNFLIFAIHSSSSIFREDLFQIFIQSDPISIKMSSDLAVEKPDLASDVDSPQEKSDLSSGDLQAIIASLLQKDPSSPFSGQNFQFLQPPFDLERKESPKLMKLKAKKARKEIRLKEKNVAKSFRVEPDDGGEAYDLDAVLASLGENQTPPNSHKSKK